MYLLLSSSYVVCDKSNLNDCVTIVIVTVCLVNTFIKIFRTKYETQEKQLTNKVSALEKEKLALKSQLSDIINELTQVVSFHFEIFIFKLIKFSERKSDVHCYHKFNLLEKT